QRRLGFAVFAEAHPSHAAEILRRRHVRLAGIDRVEFPERFAGGSRGCVLVGATTVAAKELRTRKKIAALSPAFVTIASSLCPSLQTRYKSLSDMTNWAIWQPRVHATLLFIVRDGKI